ncbi:MAG TPA: GNAT family N-acetyltransferase [Burkholderiales bacterium]|nr:GNAT family N-acetyltransferase [Burkholderiales bacterium]
MITPRFLDLRTARLCLREFRREDAPAVQRLADDPGVAEGTLLPHPYRPGIAEAWIARQAAAFAAGREVNFAIERGTDAALLGAAGLEIDAANARAKLGFWIGRPHWGQGYCTEAAGAIVAYGFQSLGLQRICTPRFRWNAASARVLEKLGFWREGCRRDYVPARGRIEIVETHGLLRWEWETQREQHGIDPAARSLAESEFGRAA